MGKLKTLLLLMSDWFKQAKLNRWIAINLGMLAGSFSAERFATDEAFE